MLRLNVFLRVSESNRAEVAATAKELVAASLAEQGCVAYDLFESATRHDVMLICETWKDEESLAAHKQSAHYAKFGARLHELSEMKSEIFEF